MNKLKIVLLCPLLAAVHSYGMELEAELLAEPAITIPKQSRVPSLKHLILSKIGSLLIKQDTHVSISSLDQVYQGAEADCARILAEDERVAIWNEYGNEKKAVELDHCALIANGFADEVRENTVYAATFTPDDKFLLTLTCKKDVQANYVLNVWRVSDFSERLARRHEAVAHCNDVVGAGTIKIDDAASQGEALENGGMVNEEKIERYDPVKPCSEFVIRPMNHCVKHMFKVICHPTSSLVVLTLPYGDCYFLSLSAKGILTRLSRLNILPLAKRLRPNEGTREEEELNQMDFFDQGDSRIYIKLLEFNSVGNKLLMHVDKATYHETEENRRGGPLYCFPIDNFDNPTLFAPAPVINILDETYQIAQDVDVAVWRQDGTISYIDNRDYRTLHSITAEGESMGNLELQFAGVQERPLRLKNLVLRKYANDLIISSRYTGNPCGGESYRIDRCSLINGSCIRLHDLQNYEDEIDFTGNECQPYTIDIQFLSDERFALKIFEDSGEFYVILWDVVQNSSADIALLKNSYHGYSYALSRQGSFLFIADCPNWPGLPKPCKFSTVMSLGTPHVEALSLHVLIGFCKKV